MILTAVFLLGTTLLSQCSAFVVPSPGNKQYVYDYHASTNMLSSMPVNQQAQWGIDSKLIVQAFKDYSIFKLAETKVYMHNGVADPNGSDEFKRLDLPEEAHVYMEPFIVYHNNSIGVPEDEPIWSINMKKSLASLFQVDTTQLDKRESDVTEQTIYGPCKIGYKVLDSGTNNIKLIKKIDVEKCEGSMMLGWGSLKETSCSGWVHTPLTADIKRMYLLNKKGNNYVISKIATSATVTHTRFPDDNRYKEIKQNQMIQLMSKTDVKDKFNILKVTEVKDLKLEQGNEKKTGAKLGQKKTIEKAIDHMKELKKYLNKDKVESYITSDASLDNIYGTIQAMSEQELIELFKLVEHDQQMKKIFLYMLPYFGAEASISFMEKIIKTKKESQFYLVKILADFPLHIENHSEELLHKMKYLMNMQSTSNIVRNSAIMSFASLVHEVYTAEKCSETLYNTFVKQYLTLFKESKNYNDRMAYMLGLNNLNVDPELLIPIIVDENELNDLRALAIKAAKIKLLEDPEKVFKTFLPMLKNETLVLELRTVALNMLLETKSSEANMKQIVKFITTPKETPDYINLYNYFYTTLESYYYPTLCEEQITVFSDKYFKKIDEPEETDDLIISGNYRTSFTDNGPNFGQTFQYKVIKNTVTDSISMIEFIYKDTFMQFEHDITIQFKLHGIWDYILEQLYLKKGKNIPTIAEFMKILEKNHLKINNIEKLSIDIIAFIDNRSVFAAHVDTFTMEKILKSIDIIKLKSFKDLLIVGYPAMVYDALPSDLGTVIYITFETEYIHTFDLECPEDLFTRNVQENLFLGYRSRNLWAVTETMNTENPFSDVNLGVFVTIQVNTLMGNKVYLLDGKGEDHGRLLWNSNDLYIHNMLEIARGSAISNESVLRNFCQTCKKLEIYEETHPHIEQKEFTKDNAGERFYFSYNGTKILHLRGLRQQMAVAHFENSKEKSQILTDAHLLIHLFVTPPWNSLKVISSLQSTPNEVVKTIIGVVSEHEELESDKEILTGVKGKVTFLVTVRKADKLIERVNVTMKWIEEPGLRDQKYGLRVDTQLKSGSKLRFCTDLQLNLPEVPSDMYALQPLDPTKAKWTVNFGPHDLIEDNCPQNRFVMTFDGLFSATEEQKEEVLKGKRNPYKQCFEDKKGFKYVPPTESCIKASEIISTYRKYEGNLTIAECPDPKFIACEAVQFMENMLDIPKYTSMKMELSTTLPIAKFQVNDDETSLEYKKSKQLVDAMLLNVRDFTEDDLDSDLSFLEDDKQCTITRDFATTFEEETLANYTGKFNVDMLGLIECQKAEFGVIFTRNVDSMGIKVWSDDIVMTATPTATGLTVKADGNEIKTKQRYENDEVKLYFLNKDIIKIKTSTMHIYFNKEYVSIKVDPLMVHRTCGLCSPQENIVYL